jgi:hypothetical protein
VGIKSARKQADAKSRAKRPQAREPDTSTGFFALFKDFDNGIDKLTYSCGDLVWGSVEGEMAASQLQAADASGQIV